MYQLKHKQWAKVTPAAFEEPSQYLDTATMETIK